MNNPTEPRKILDNATPTLDLFGMIGRNTNMVNFFNLCAISLPLPHCDGLPVGLMIVARNGQDHKLLRMAAAVERLFKT